MIVDIDQVDPLPLADHYDVCIAGGGVAGITLALRLAARKRRVLILEAGGFEFSEVSQDVYRGANVGYSYHDLATARLRYFGGTSGHWNGQCRPLDSHDFLRHEHIPESGWPIRIADVQPYLAEARSILELDAFPEASILPRSAGQLREITFRWSPPVRFGDKFRKPLSDSGAVDVLLNANLVEIRTDPGNGRVSGFVFRGYADGRPNHEATAGRFVLALGGIENPRMLLNQGQQGL
ncbi:MAG: FAD-dependent oxidoreductase, partial [Geminicoccales bacterium]